MIKYHLLFRLKCYLFLFKHVGKVLLIIYKKNHADHSSNHKPNDKSCTNAVIYNIHPLIT